MGRGPTIAHKKAANAQAKAKLISLHAKLLALAAKHGDDPKDNPLLHEAIVQAKKSGVSNDVIERAIQRGSGKGNPDEQVEEIIYEGYGPEGIACIVRAITDNRKRTAPNIRRIFSQNGGSLGETGSLSKHLFSYQGRIICQKPESYTQIQCEELLFNLEIEDYIFHENTIELSLRPELVGQVQKNSFFESFPIEEVSFQYIPKSTIQVQSLESALRLAQLLSDFSLDEDVECVWNSAEITDDLWNEVQSILESRRFKT